MGTMVLPWLAGVPLFIAGYNLDEIPLTRTTIPAAIAVTMAFFLVSTSVGLSWNWKWWPLAAVAFWLPFLVFFTTFFSNGNGLGTGVVGSLGYWLEQQGVRRGSQPQYYYTLVQVPIYEYMPLLISAIAGFAGLSYVFQFRTASRLHQQAEAELPDEANAGIDTEETDGPGWTDPYDHVHEQAMRRNHFEYIGEIPFLQFVGYWAIIMFTALTLAGEKMPWLTSHITIPFIFLAGWYVGHVIEKIDWKTVREGGWLLILVIVPVFIIALVQVLLPYFTGENRPFRSSQSVIELESTGQWLAALLALGGTGYFLGRMIQRTGWEQARRMIFGSVVLVLTLATARHAWIASYINYDYATEFLVYAHAGPAVKTVMDDIAYIADRHPDGNRISIVYDEESTWPMVWYLRDYNNLTYITTEGIQNDPSPLEGKLVIIVGERKNDTVERYLGDDYFRFDYIRLWWPMQEYFNLSFERVSALFGVPETNPAASLYRRGIWDIWWDRNYETYGQAKCLEQEARSKCLTNTSPEQYDAACVERWRNACLNDHRPATEEIDREFGVEDWPVRDKLFMYVRKDFAVQIWDIGLDGKSVSERLIPDPENVVEQIIEPLGSFGQEFLRNPRDVAVDDSGTIYVLDTENGRIAVYDPLGNLQRTFGEDVLGAPWGIDIDHRTGNIFVANTFPLDLNSIVVFSPAGELIQNYGQFGRPEDFNSLEPPTMFGPREVTVDNTGRVYVADTGGHRVRVYDEQFNLLYNLKNTNPGVGSSSEPVGIAINPISGEVYVAETWNQQISVYNREGTVLRSWKVNMWEGTRNISQRPYLSFSPDGTLLLVSDMDSSAGNNGPRVVAYDLSGQPVISFNAPPGSPHYVNAVAGMAFGPDGRLFVVDSASSRIVIFPPLLVTGNLAPLPNPNYPATRVSAPPIDDTSSPEDMATAEDISEASFTGTLYWQSLRVGNYGTYQALHCPDADILSEEEFLNTLSAQYQNMDMSLLGSQVQIKGDRAVLTWTGEILIAPGTDLANRIPADQLPPLFLKRVDGAWLICPADIFRPGGA
jgi:DNA-binding beta-propeller fold protein YncE